MELNPNMKLLGKKVPKEPMRITITQCNEEFDYRKTYIS